MSDISLLTQLADMGDRAAVEADNVSGGLGSIKALILEHFGPNGLTAAYVVVAVVVLVVVWRLTKITFVTLKYLVVPAIALAVLGTFVLPYSFVMLLPMTVVGCSLILLVKG
jgi:hypothetical protein